MLLKVWRAFKTRNLARSSTGLQISNSWQSTKLYPRHGCALARHPPGGLTERATLIVSLGSSPHGSTQIALQLTQEGKVPRATKSSAWSWEEEGSSVFGLRGALLYFCSLPPKACSLLGIHSFCHPQTQNCLLPWRCLTWIFPSWGGKPQWPILCQL